MSSIIKSGYAPSNIADGKYFLETDQACYAELKRNRTYICTAQEASKVSHYVIITNADFTATFNGDSDLVQVGRANNAIVMNVHRACRIDFVQGGNLEFKEGTAEFSSRIEMGVNASGNVLVAASLPQQGDFAGQICSLTTGATYVWTGSEWSSTAGTATLPTPTSSNIGNVLLSNGASWEVAKLPYFRKLTSIGASFTPVGGKYLGFELCTNNETAGFVHFGFDIQCGTHGKTSRKAHVEFYAAEPTLASSWCWITYSAAGGTTGETTTPTNWVRLYKDASTKKLYVGIKQATGVTYQTNASIFNMVTNDNVTWNSNLSIVAFTNDIEAETSLSAVTIKEFTAVPVSTAANQMLVSDGNGGWTTMCKRVQALSSTGSAQSGYLLKLIATRPAATGKYNGQLSFDVTVGWHNIASFNGKGKVLIDGSNRTCGYTDMMIPAYGLSSTGHQSASPVKVSAYGEIGIGMIIENNTTSCYLIIHDTGFMTSIVPKITMDNIIGDEDWTYATDTAWTLNTTALPSGMITSSVTHYEPTVATA